MILAGDIGGTHTRLAFFEKGKMLIEEKFPSRAYTELETIVEQFLKGKNYLVQIACLGIAGPIRNGKCKATNLPWIVDAAAIQQKLKIPEVHLLNDLEAHAYGISCLQEDEFVLIQKGRMQAVGHQALISAGTGLGEACLFWNGSSHVPIPSEGGHVDFAPRNDLEIELLLYLQKFPMSLMNGLFRDLDLSLSLNFFSIRKEPNSL
jgi:glucokinase